MNSPIIINRMSPLSVLGVLGVIFYFIFFFRCNFFFIQFLMKFLYVNRIAPDGMLCCFSVPHKKEAMLI